MKKTLFFVTMFFLVVWLTGCTQQQTIVEDELGQQNECRTLCSQTNSICPNLSSVSQCEKNCQQWSAEVKDQIKQATSCQELSQIPEYVSVLIPEMEEPKLKPATNDCEAACGHYVTACLTLVPNATQALFDDGYNSCLDECQKWNKNKVDCMISAFDCEAMTDVCGL